MSGSTFNYNQHHIQDIIDTLEDVHGNYGSEYLHENLSEETFDTFKDALLHLHLARIYTHRLDWLLSGDDSEDTFHERLWDDLKEFWVEWYNKEGVK